MNVKVMSEDDRAEGEAAGPARRAGWVRQRLLSADGALVAAGFGLAAFAAFFPWYVFFNQEKFGIAPVQLNATRDLPETPGRNVVSVSPLAIPDQDDGAMPPSDFDPVMTATVPGLGAEEKGAPVRKTEPSQPFPGSPEFRLLHVANGRALIEDPSGMFLVRIGSVLPDNSRLAALEKRDGKWVIVTSDGKVIGN